MVPLVNKFVVPAISPNFFFLQNTVEMSNVIMISICQAVHKRIPDFKEYCFQEYEFFLNVVLRTILRKKMRTFLRTFFGNILVFKSKKNKKAVKKNFILKKVS